MADAWTVLDGLTWVFLGAAPVLLLASFLHESLRGVPVSGLLRGLGKGALLQPEDVPMASILLAEHTRLNRERNLALAYLEHLAETAALALPSDPAMDTLSQRAVRQQLQACATWCARLRQRDLSTDTRGAA